jgi:hypothetical protein
MRDLKWLSLNDVKKSIPAMDRQGVSKVARGVDPSSQTKEGWVQAYIATGGNPVAMSQRLTGRNDHETWKDRRKQFLARHLEKVRRDNEPLWRNGEPTRRHLALVAWGYSPTISRLQKWLKTQPSLSSGEWKRGVKILKKNPSNVVFRSKQEITDIELSVTSQFRISEREDGTHWAMKVLIEDTMIGSFYGVILSSIDTLQAECQTAVRQLIDLNEQPMIVIVESSHINQPMFRNKGIGVAVYKKVIGLIQGYYQKPIIYMSNHCTDGSTSEMAMSVWSKLSQTGEYVSDEDFFSILYPYPPVRSNPSIGYNSWAWTTQDWRSIFLHSDGSVSYDKKCGSKGTKLPSGKPRLCLPLYVIKQLLKTKSGKEILIQQARKKQRAKKGQRIAWHPKIKELHSKLEAKTPVDDPKLRRKNPNTLSQFFLDRNIPAVMLENVLIAKVDGNSLALLQDYSNFLGIEIHPMLEEECIHIHSDNWDETFIGLHQLFS